MDVYEYFIPLIICVLIGILSCNKQVFTIMLLLGFLPFVNFFAIGLIVSFGLLGLLGSILEKIGI
jgi:hypothetical protein